MTDTCIHDGNNQIVLFPLMRCSMDGNPNNNQMFGAWEKKDGTREKICWHYEHIIFIYTKDRVFSYNPDDISIECPVL